MQRIETKKINDIKINPLPIPKIDTDKIKGSELFPEIYSNIFLIAKKKSGKTQGGCSVVGKPSFSCSRFWGGPGFGSR